MRRVSLCFGLALCVLLVSSAALEAQTAPPIVNRPAATLLLPYFEVDLDNAQGMTTLNDSLIELVKKKVVEPREAYAKSVGKAEFKSLLDRAGVKVDVDLTLVNATVLERVHGRVGAPVGFAAPLDAQVLGLEKLWTGD